MSNTEFNARRSAMIGAQSPVTDEGCIEYLLTPLMLQV